MSLISDVLTIADPGAIAFFFPLQQAGSFFGQWNNLFMWFSIGFALSQSNFMGSNEK